MRPFKIGRARIGGKDVTIMEIEQRLVRLDALPGATYLKPPA